VLSRAGAGRRLRPGPLCGCRGCRLGGALGSDPPAGRVGRVGLHDLDRFLRRQRQPIRRAMFGDRWDGPWSVARELRGHQDCPCRHGEPEQTSSDGCVSWIQGGTPRLESLAHDL